MSYTYSTPGTATYSVTFDTLDQMMAVFPDNNANLIAASDVRDAVLTLYWQTQDLGASFSATASAFYYTNLSPSTIAVGGISTGTTFSNVGLQQLFDDMFYPYTAPSCSISASNTPRELGSSNAVTLSWSATKAKLNIVTITVDGTPVVPTNVAVQTGTKNTTATQNTFSTFSMSVSDGTSTINSSTSVTWLNAVYWGKTSNFSLPSMTIVGTQPAWADGAGVGSGKSLSSTKSGSYNGINGAGQYLVFAWPTSFGTPTFTINGLPNTAFTKLGNAISFTNMHGYVNTYDVWLSNTAQNSPITSFVIS
jgi:hypothetical protein